MKKKYKFEPNLFIVFDMNGMEYVGITGIIKGEEVATIVCSDGTTGTVPFIQIENPVVINMPKIPFYNEKWVTFQIQGIIGIGRTYLRNGFEYVGVMDSSGACGQMLFTELQKHSNIDYLDLSLINKNPEEEIDPKLLMLMTSIHGIA